MGQEADSQCMDLKASSDANAPARSKNAKISYTREFLLSFAELENCKVQPSELDPQVLRNPPPGLVIEAVNASSTFSTRGLIRRDKDGSGEALQNIPEWCRTRGSSGGLLAQGSKRVDHGAALYTNNYSSRAGSIRGETIQQRNNYDRSGWQGPGSGGGQGRWEHRPGSGDKERDRSRHDWDSLEQDSGRRYRSSDHLLLQGGTPPEHDGLLGSGSDLRLSRPSGGSLLPISKGHDGHHASGRPHQANDTFQPLRSSKISTHSRTEIRDRFNDETFGNDEISSNERIEEERRRRDSFELMRKEQHKILQEKQKLSLHKQGEQLEWKSGVSSDKKDEHYLADDGEKLDRPASSPLPDQFVSSTSVKTQSTMSTASARPLVPPGFTKPFIGKHASLKTANREVSEAASTEICKDRDDTFKLDPSLDGTGHQTEGKQKPDDKEATVDVDGHVRDLPAADIADYPRFPGDLDTVSNPRKANIVATLAEIEHDIWNIGLDNDLDIKKEGDPETGKNTCKERPKSILERLFVKAPADFDKAEIHILDQTEGNGIDNGAPKSSKFARFFHTEEEKTSVQDTSDILSKREKVMLPSIGTEDRVQTDEIANSPLSSILPVTNSCKVLPMPNGPSLEDVEKFMTVKPVIKDDMDQLEFTRDLKSDAINVQLNVDDDDLLNKKVFRPSSTRKPRVVLTCEDLEQSIIAEASGIDSSVQHKSQDNHSVSELKHLSTEQKLSLDNHASQHLLSLLQKGINTRDQQSQMVQEHEERYIGPSKNIDHHENFGNAGRDEIPEKTGAQTLEFLFDKAFMNELRSADAPVSLKAPSPSKPLSNDFAVQDSGLESSFGMSLKRHNFLPSTEFDTHTRKLDAFLSLGKMSVKDGKILGSQSQQVSFDDNAYVHEQDLWHSTSDTNNDIRSSIGSSHFESPKSIGNRNLALFGTGPKVMPNPVNKGEYSSGFNSDIGGDVFETSRFQEGNSIMRTIFDPGNKKPVFDAGSRPTGYSLMGKNHHDDTKLSPNGRPILDEFMRSNLSGSQISDKFIFSDVPGTIPDIVQKNAVFSEEKSRFEEQDTRVHEMGIQHYRGGDVAVLESKFSLTDMMGTSRPLFANASIQGGGVEQTHSSNSSGIHQLLGLPSHTSHPSQQQVLGPTDVPFSHPLPGPQARPPPAFFPYHGPGPYDLNLGAINAIPNQQINHQQLPQNRHKLFDQGNSLEPQHPSPDGWSEHFPGRSFSHEQSGQMLYSHPNGPPMNQAVYHSVRPHSLAPNHFLQHVPMPQRGLSPVNNFPLIPDQVPHAPRGLPPNFPQHMSGPFFPEIPIHMQGPPFHLQPSQGAFGTPHNQTLRSNLGASPEFNVPVDGRQHAGAMGNDAAVLDMLFAKESKRQPVGPLPVNQYPGRNMGYG